MDKGIWKYRDLLPEVENKVTLYEGSTPLIETETGFYIKDETRNPTGSFEDRFSAFAISVMKDRGIEYVNCDEDHNRTLSFTAYAAKARITSFVPVQDLELLLYGAKLKRSKKESPFTEIEFHEGEKTTCYEILEELAPEYLVVPMGSGSHISMLFKGMMDYREMGLVKNLPRLVGVQPHSYSPIVSKYLNVSAEKGESVATSLMQKPLFLDNAIRAIKETSGFALTVEEEEILRSQEDLAREGILVDTSSATAYAARHYLESKKRDVVFILTGKFRSHTSKYSLTKVLILKLLSEHPMHGYEIWKRVKKSKELTVQSIYLHLHDLEKTGDIVMIKDGRRKVFEITGKGRRMLM